MKKNVYKFLSFIMLTVTMGVLRGQDLAQNLGSQEEFISGLRGQLKNAKAAALGNAKPIIKLKIPGGGTINAEINYSVDTKESYVLRGTISNKAKSNFFLDYVDGDLSGAIIIDHKAYSYALKNNTAIIKEMDIHELLCHDFHPEFPASKEPASLTTKPANTLNSAEVLSLQSLPGGAGCIYLDFDGEYVVGTRWLGGAAINASPADVSDAVIREAWEIVSEDYRPFNMNVTTSRSVFNSYPKNRRMMCINTRSKTVTNTGVAYIGSFAWNDDTPCWGTMMTSGKVVGEVVSHEIGHTLDLLHDGRNLSTGTDAYYKGHGDWAPIMGNSYSKAITQFCKGEYTGANNRQDDLLNITSTKFGVGFRRDDHGENIASASLLVVSADGNISSTLNKGVIERTTDLDYFKFTTSGGTLSLKVNTVSRHGNLDVMVRLYNQSGTLLGTYNPAGLHCTVSSNLSPGTYYFSVEGTGAGTVNTGYSDYASLGSYSMSGTVSPGVVVVTYRNPENPGNTTSGLDYKYYEGNWTMLPSFNALTAVKSGNVASFSLSPRNRNDQFAFQFNGYIQVPTDGIYNFYTSSDDGSKLYIGSTEVVNNDGAHPDVERSGSIGLKAGKHAITVTYFEQAGEEILNVSYSGPGIAKQLIGATSLFRLNNIVVTQSPYGGTAWPIPGRIEAENYDLGGEGLAFHDVEASNLGGMYRNEAVDIETCTDLNGGFSLGFIRVGEWVEYSVNVTQTNTYRMDLRVASALSGKSVRLEMNGTTIGGTIAVPNTAGWQNWTTISVSNISLTQGPKVLRIVGISDDININHINFAIIGSGGSTPINILPTVSITAPVSGTTYNAPANITFNAAASDNDGTISKVEYYNGSVKIGEALTSPYGFSWNNVAAGSYQIVAKATDNSGGISNSQTILIMVNTVDACAAIAQYVENSGYVEGSKVKNEGNVYECKPWPYSGWCNGASWAYGPGTGSYWTDAWTLVGACSAAAEAPEFNVSNPVEETTTVIFDNSITQYGNVMVYDVFGKEVFSATQVESGQSLDLSRLSKGVYLLAIHLNGVTSSTRIIKE